MFIVYILRSLKNNKRYVGYTSKDVFIRLEEHNNGCNKWTRENGPFKIINAENYITKTEAIRRERILKTVKGRKWIDSNLNE